MPDESIDVICIDPPYLYLKGQKLERPFDEQLFFSECQRLLTKKGFLVMFGRGPSFYRWNTILDELGMVFKEEVVWDKSHGTSPLMPMSRVHETISVYAKASGKVNRSKVPYLEMKANDIESIVGDVKRLKAALRNTKSLDAVMCYLANNERDKSDSWGANNVSISSSITKEDRCVSVARSIQEGMNEKTIIRSDFYDSKSFTKFGVTGKRKDGDRCVKVVNSIVQGMNEKTIIKEIRNHYKAIHPTEKPVRLLERLLNLVIPIGKEKIVIADWFMGSGSCGEAVCNISKVHPETQFEFIGTEIDEEYFLGADNRLKALQPVQKELFG